MLVGRKLVVAAVDCYCRMLLLVAAVDCCCWLLLLIAAAGGWCWLLLLVAAVDCPKSLWIFPEYSWWFAAKTILQAKKSLNIFGLLTKSLWIFSGCWWKVFEYFQNIDERKVEESFASGKLVVDSSKRMNIMAVHWVSILDTFKMAVVLAGANRIIWWEIESGKVGSIELNLRLRQVLKLS